MIKTGCFFGSFNPIHVGHLMVAEFMATATDLDEVVLIVSPQNPLKEQKLLADEDHRFEMARSAIEDNPRLEVSDIEFRLSRPSYTIQTLDKLAGDDPTRSYVLIMGSDNLDIFEQWYQWDRILNEYGCYVYGRRGSDIGAWSDHPQIRIFEPPLIDVSATYIRECITVGRSIRYLVPDRVIDYIEDNNVFDFLRK